MTGLMNLTNKKFHKAPHKPFAVAVVWFKSHAQINNDSFLSVNNV